MIIRKDECRNETREHMRGGAGEVCIRHFTDRDGLYGKGRMFSHILLKPGCEVGKHDHHNEEEIFVFIKGSAVYDDNGTEYNVHEGDIAFCKDGEYHRVINNTDEDCEMIALILDK
ncbi:MAG: cupin domain-containing protein [Erysipelotrichaceae bacterium]|nr:cupin domain-containing protein [Erysipelotrichaceae bacterium]